MTLNDSERLLISQGVRVSWKSEFARMSLNIGANMAMNLEALELWLLKIYVLISVINLFILPRRFNFVLDAHFS